MSARHADLAVLSVGQGDAIVFRPHLGAAVVVDLGDARRVYDYLVQHQVADQVLIVLTHTHRDHTPAVEGLLDFLLLLSNVQKEVTIVAPPKLYDGTVESIKAGKASSVPAERQRAARIEHALNRLVALRNAGTVRFIWGQRGNVHQAGDALVRVIFPDPISSAIQHVMKPGKVNESSIVVRVEFGAFTVLLPGDLEGDGCESLLSQASDSELGCSILKIPHHGAWPNDPSSLETLLSRSDPQLSVLSVGSTNRYGHVRTELFSALRKLAQSGRLQRLACTQATATCVNGFNSSPPLSHVHLCAGDIVIRATDDGTWTQERLAEHLARINGWSRPGCDGLNVSSSGARP